MPQNQIKPLTSLRFFAALWVVLYTYIHELEGATDITMFQKGYLGVDLFFILSGFILSYVYLEAFGEKRFDYGKFVIQRVARVYPLHLATLGFTLLLVTAAGLKGVHLDGNVANWASLPAHLTLTQAWGLAPTASFNHPSWSISAEWFAYLCFPAVAAIAWPLRSRPALAVSLAAGFLIALNAAFYGLSGFLLTKATFQWGALRIVPTFLFGSALYLAWRAGAVAKPRLATAGAIVGPVSAIAACFVGYDSLVILALGLTVLSVGGLDRDREGFMSSKLLVYLGEISFATYMIYVPWSWVYLKGADLILKLDGSPLPLIWWLVGLVALVPLSMMAHHLIELPCRRQLRRWGDLTIERLSSKLT